MSILRKERGLSTWQGCLLQIRSKFNNAIVTNMPGILGRAKPSFPSFVEWLAVSAERVGRYLCVRKKALRESDLLKNRQCACSIWMKAGRTIKVRPHFLWSARLQQKIGSLRPLLVMDANRARRPRIVWDSFHEWCQTLCARDHKLLPSNPIDPAARYCHHHPNSYSRCRSSGDVWSWDETFWPWNQSSDRKFEETIL